MQMMSPTGINVDTLTKEECVKYTDKGRRWYMEFLLRFAEQGECFASDPETKRELFRMLGSLYRKRMYTNKDFFTKVAGFVSQRHMTSEKDVFFKVITKELKNSYDVKAELCKKYPDKYGRNSADDVEEE